MVWTWPRLILSRTQSSPVPVLCTIPQCDSVLAWLPTGLCLGRDEVKALGRLGDEWLFEKGSLKVSRHREDFSLREDKAEGPQQQHWRGNTKGKTKGLEKQRLFRAKKWHKTNSEFVWKDKTNKIQQTTTKPHTFNCMARKLRQHCVLSVWHCGVHIPKCVLRGARARGEEELKVDGYFQFY